jgi:hypothetical protein
MDGAAHIARGTLRLLHELGYAAIREFTLGSGRRADIAAIDASGRLLIIEIKSCRADFLADEKWQSYLDYCDAFAFAVGTEFPRELLPAETGLIIADRYGGQFLRPPYEQSLNASRRKAEILRFARVAAQRLIALDAPPAASDH